MRGGLAVLVAGIAIVLAPTVGGVGPPTSGGLQISGCPPYVPAGTTCVYTVTASDPTIVFFRWDFERDGVWDHPDQAGAGSLGRWTTALSVTWTFAQDGMHRVCVQGWDGVSVGPGPTPVGPIACRPPGPPPGLP